MRHITKPTSYAPPSIQVASIIPKPALYQPFKGPFKDRVEPRIKEAMAAASFGRVGSVEWGRSVKDGACFGKHSAS